MKGRWASRLRSFGVWPSFYVSDKDVCILYIEWRNKCVYRPLFVEEFYIQPARHPRVVQPRPVPTVSVLRSVSGSQSTRALHSAGPEHGEAVAATAAGESVRDGWREASDARPGRNGELAGPSAGAGHPSSGPSRGRPGRRLEAASCGTSSVSSGRTTACRVVCLDWSLRKR